MLDIVQEAWNTVSECTLLAQQASDAQAAAFFRKLASSWRGMALSYEALERNDCYLVELKRLREFNCVPSSTADPHIGRRSLEWNWSRFLSPITWMFRRSPRKQTIRGPCLPARPGEPRRNSRLKRVHLASILNGGRCAMSTLHCRLNRLMQHWR